MGVDTAGKPDWDSLLPPMVSDSDSSNSDDEEEEGEEEGVSDGRIRSSDEAQSRIIEQHYGIEAVGLAIDIAKMAVEDSVDEDKVRRELLKLRGMVKVKRRERRDIEL